MKQKLALFTICAAIASTVQAQSPFKKLNDLQAKHHAFTQAILNNSVKNAGRLTKPTAIKQRVVAQVLYTPDGIDSSRYAYLDNKGSTFEHNQLIRIGYSTMFAPDFAPAFIENAMPPSTDLQAYQINNYSDNIPAGESIAYYNDLGLIDSAVNYYGEGYAESWHAVYNEAGRIIDFKDYYLLDGEVMFGLGRKISYSGSQVVTDTMFQYETSWMPYSSLQYTYNDLGQLTSVEQSEEGSAFTYKVSFRYDGSNRLRASDAVYMISGEVYPLTSDTIGYTEGVSYPTLYQQVDYDEEAELYRMIKYPGAHQGPDSLITQTFIDDTWETDLVAYFTYNEFDNPTLLDVVPIMADPEELVDKMVFHYETYDDGLAVMDEGALAEVLVVYPNPFSNELNISYKGAQKERVQFQLTDIGGRTIVAGTKILESGDNTLTVPTLASGNYLFTLTNEKGQRYTQKLTRQ
jgi:hypothetical protein